MIHFFMKCFFQMVWFTFKFTLADYIHLQKYAFIYFSVGFSGTKIIVFL